jgi:hypothetical protein
MEKKTYRTEQIDYLEKKKKFANKVSNNSPDNDNRTISNSKQFVNVNNPSKLFKTNLLISQKITQIQMKKLQKCMFQSRL